MRPFLAALWPALASAWPARQPTPAPAAKESALIVKHSTVEVRSPAPARDKPVAPAGDALDPGHFLKNPSNGSVDLSGMHSGKAECSWSLNTPNAWKAWTESGCNKMLHDWFQENGTENWLNEMDLAFYTKGHSDLNCNHRESKHCTPPRDQCHEMDNRPYYYIRQMAVRANSVFGAMHEALQDNAITNLGDIAQLFKDFEFPKEKKTEAAKRMRQVGAVLSIIGSSTKIIPAVKKGTEPLGDILSIANTFMSLASMEVKLPKEPDFDKLQAAAHSYAIETFKAVQQNLEDTLMALFGAGDSKVLEQLRTGTQAGESVDTGRDVILDILSSGKFMVPIEDSEIYEVFQQALKEYKTSIIGQFLAALRFSVFATKYVDKNTCLATESGAAVYLATDAGPLQPAGCYYLVYRIENTRDTKLATTKMVAALTNRWGVDMVGMMDNIRRCNNRPSAMTKFNASDHDPSMYYTQQCMFGIPYITTNYALFLPLSKMEYFEKWLHGKAKHTGLTQPDWTGKQVQPHHWALDMIPFFTFFASITGHTKEYGIDEFNEPCNRICERKHHQLS